MSKIQRHCCSALGLLAIFYVSAAVSLAQNPPTDPFADLPASDALIVLDIKRVGTDVVPRLLTDEQDARALVIGLLDPKKIELLDPRAIQRLITGFHYRNPQKDPSDFDVVSVAQSSEAGQLPALIRTRGAGKYREQQYAGKLLYITQLEPPEPGAETTSAKSSDDTEWAITAIDANTLVFGTPTQVRSSIDLTTGKGAPVSTELVAAVKRKPKALLSAAGQLPPALISAGQQLANSNLSQMLSSVKGFYASVELIPAGLQVAVTLNTTGPEQAKGLVDLLGAFKTIAVNLSSGKTTQDKAMGDVFKGLLISAPG